MRCSRSFSRPKAKPMVLIIAACMVFACLLKPLGLVVSSILLVFVAALGGHEYRTKEVAILAAALAVFSVLVFVKGLTLPFPVWPAFLQ
ncbi:MAG: tripartite tricarboxylate transporter TctB family protein [Burkholderiales bacterium]|nr:tripartite tricarboxylate transporter TctB family protein [Burkholderiales bacterium]